MSNKVVRIKKRNYKKMYQKRNLMQIFAKGGIIFFAIAAIITILYFIFEYNHLVVKEDVFKSKLPYAVFYERENRIDELMGTYTKPDITNSGEYLVPKQNGAIYFAIGSKTPITSASYDISTLDGQGLQTVKINIKKRQNNNNKKVLENEKLFRIEPNIGEGIDYYRLVIKVKTDKHRLYFPIKIYNQDDEYMNKSLEFAKKFANSTLSQNKLNKYEKYLESNRNESEDTFKNVTIKSSTDYIGWVGLHAKRLTKPKMFIKSVNDSVYTIISKYRVKVKVSGAKQNYFVTEIFDVYSKENKVLQLMNYRRNIDREILDGDKLISGKSLELSMGKISAGQTQMHYNHKGDLVTFVLGKMLWQYDRSKSTIRKIYPLLDDTKSIDLITNDRDIKIINTAEDGSINFAVSGLNLYSDNTGKTGMGIFYYEGNDTNRVYEDAFVESGLSLNDMKKYLYKYIGNFHDNKMTYFLEDSSLNMYDGKKIKKIDDIYSTDLFKANERGSLVAYTDSNGDIVLRDLLKSNKIKIDSGSGYILKTIGFSKNDLVYGLSYDKDTKEFQDGTKLTPMSKLEIVDKMGRVLKQYQIKDRMIQAASIYDDNVQVQIVKTQDNKYFYEYTDYINNKTKYIKSKSYIRNYLTTDYGVCTDIVFKKILDKDLNYEQTNLVSEIR